MNAMTTFDFEGSAVRSLTDEQGAPWWVGKDVCDCLGHGNHRQVLTKLEDDERDDVQILDAIGRKQSTTVVNEAGIYNLIFTSRTAAAARFKRWLAHEVLPALRATGRYEMAETEEDSGDLIEPDLLDPDQERMWQGRILLYARVWGKRGAQWAFKQSPLPAPPMNIRLDLNTVEENPLQDFIADCIESDPQSTGIRFWKIWRTYELWCRENGRQKLPKTKFGICMRDLGIKKRKSGGLLYMGIALKSPET